MTYEHIIRAVFDEPWALMPSKYDAICEVVRLHAAGLRLPRTEIDAITAAAEQRRPAGRGGGAVAVIPVFGIIAQRMSLMSEMSGGTSTERLAQDIRSAVNDEMVSAILLNIDSPGGSVYGVQELADVIYQARGTKPIFAIANSLAASAAYYIASQADEVVITPSGEVGSIGVFTAHIDESVAIESEGLKVTLISAGKYKTEGASIAPLADDARAYIQSRVDDYYTMFVNSVARGRGVKASDVRNGYGEGRVVGARDAVKMGMADRVATLDDTIARLAAGGGRKAMQTAALTDGYDIESITIMEQPTTAEAVEAEQPAPEAARPERDRRRRLKSA